MAPYGLTRRLAAETIGTAFLAGAVVGSGIMAERLTDDAAVVLLCNALATAMALVVLVAALRPISGAHLNPLVTLAFLVFGRISSSDAVAYLIGQVSGAFAGVAIAHLMFELAPLQLASTARTGFGQWTAEFVATFGLLGVILSGERLRDEAMGALVGLYIGAAYWFTSSTSFANPVLALARGITDTFAGIRPTDIPAFVAAEAAGAAVAVVALRWLVGGPSNVQQEW
jgi:glycerol uptake facilitator-like aquaporin